MGNKLHISPDFTLPLDAVTQTFAILAKRRSGKSYTARRFAEQLYKAGQQIVIIDPKGDWWGIRSAADGKTPGLPVIVLGGEHGDLPLEAQAGEVIAKLVVEERVPILLDVSSMRKGEVASFMGGGSHDGFLEALYRLKAREQYRDPMMLIVDEADAIAPQKPYKGEERMLGAMEDIVRRGGQRGIGCMSITQRSAVLNKNVLTQSQILVVMRMIAPQDLAAIDAWVEVHGSIEQQKILKDSLPSLPTGDAWVWSPGWPSDNGIFRRIHVLPIETFDSGATPKPGHKRIEPKNAADVDIAALGRQMAATIERAKADDPKELRKRIAELEKQLKAKPPASSPQLASGAGDPEKLRKEYERGVSSVKKELGKALSDYSRQTGKLLADARSSLEAVQAEVADALQDFVSELPVPPDLQVVMEAARSHDFSSRTSTDWKAPRPTPKDLHIPVRPAAPPKPARPARAETPSDDNGRLAPVEQRILDAIAELNVLGVERPPRVQVAFLAGYTNLNSKGFVNAVGALHKSKGYISYPDPGTITLTSEGTKAASYPDTPRSSEELQQRLVQLLDPVHGRILTPLIAAYPDAIEREELAGKAGYTNLNSKGFVNAMGRLRSLGFIDYPQSGYVQAQPVLFLN